MRCPRQAVALRVLLIAALAACGRERRDVLVEYQGEVVPRSHFDAFARDLEARGGPLTAEARAAVLRTFIEERLLAFEARRLGLLEPGAPREAEDAAVRTLLERQTETIAVTPPETVAYFEANRSSFRVPATVTLRQILVRREPEALELRRRLTKMPGEFTALARTRSLGPEAEEGGLMGTFRPGELPRELEAAAFALPLGALSGVVPTPLGFHILRLEAKEDAREATLDEVRGEIRDRLLAEKKDRKVREFIDGLVSRAKVNT